MTVPNVVVGKTALLVPCVFEDGLGDDCAARAERLLDRSFVSKSGSGDTPFWECYDVNAPGMEELDPSFRSILGGGESVWSAQRLRVTQVVLSGVLAAPQLVDKKGTAHIALARFERIELFLFPLGTAMLAFHIDWCDGRKQVPLPLSRLKWLVSEARRLRTDKNQARWRFALAPAAAQRKLLGPRMSAACGGDGRVQLATVADWIVMGPDEDAADPPQRAIDSRYAIHHTAVYVDRPLPADEIGETLFHLRRGAKDTFAAPRSHGDDVTLSPRRNRHIGLCREGVASVSWQPPGHASQFERQWPVRNVMGLYLLLSVHAHAERVTLVRLGERVAAIALKLASASAVSDMRERLYELSCEMSRYSLAMTGEDCGGLSDYVAIFRALRRVMGTSTRLAEARENIRELHALVEDAYQRDRQHRADAAEARDKGFHQLVAVIGGVGVVFGIVTGLLGMDLPQKNIWGPRQPWFWALSAGTLLLSGLVVWWSRRRLKAT